MGHTLKRQCHDYSCGAASLLCAAIETKHTDFPPIGDIKKKIILAANNDSETALYYISSGSAESGRLLSEVGFARESMPSGIVAAAQHIGFKNARIYLRSTLTTAVLKRLQGDEVVKCQRIANAEVIESKAPKLKEGEYKLVVVTGGSRAAKAGMAAINYKITGNLHYVLHRPDGSYMDPGTGEDFLKMPGEYARTGISIIVS